MFTLERLTANEGDFEGINRSARAETLSKGFYGSLTESNEVGEFRTETFLLAS
jgi:hypothetical protein